MSVLTLGLVGEQIRAVCLEKTRQSAVQIAAVVRIERDYDCFALVGFCWSTSSCS